MLLWICEWDPRLWLSSKEVSIKEKEHEKKFLPCFLLFKLKKMLHGK
jgi:hypothetical protein